MTDWRKEGNEHTSIEDMDAMDPTKTIIDRYIFLVGKVKGKRILDFGCGSGHGCMIMKTYGSEYVWGYDKNKEAISEAQRTYSGVPGVDFRDTMEHFSEDSFDMIVSFEVFEHIPLKELKKLIKKLKSYLKKDGLFIITTPISRGQKSEDKFHQNEMTQNVFVNLMDEFFNEWDLYSTIEHRDGLWSNTRITNGVTPMSRCFLAVAKNDK